MWLLVLCVFCCFVFIWIWHSYKVHTNKWWCKVLCASRWLFSSFVGCKMTDGQAVDWLSSIIMDLRLSNTILHCLYLMSSFSLFASLTLIHSLVLLLCGLPFFLPLPAPLLHLILPFNPPPPLWPSLSMSHNFLQFVCFLFLFLHCHVSL